MRNIRMATVENRPKCQMNDREKSIYRLDAYFFVLGWVEGVGDKDPQFLLLPHRSLESFLDVKSFAHDRGIQLPLEGEQVHIGLGLGHKVTNL